MVFSLHTKRGLKMKASKIVKRVLLIILIVLVCVIVAALILFRNELKSLSSLKQRGKGVYTMTYCGDYGFDDFLKIGAESDKDVERFITKRLLKGLPIELNVADAGCTCFVSRNEENDVVFCRNFDFEYAPMLQVYTKPDNGYASISTVNLSFAGYGMDNLPSAGIGINNFLTLAAPYLPFDGMNEKGVCIALMAVPTANAGNSPDKVTLNTTTAIRLVLDKAADIDEAVNLLKQYNIYFSGDVECHFLIADASGKSVLVEYFDGGLQTIYPDADYQIGSNFIAYKGLNIGEGFNEFERYNTVEDVLKRNNNVVSMNECEELLNEIGIVYKGIDKLQWSAVYNLTDKTGRIWPHRDNEKAWDFALD